MLDLHLHNSVHPYLNVSAEVKLGEWWNGNITTLMELLHVNNRKYMSLLYSNNMHKLSVLPKNKIHS